MENVHLFNNSIKTRKIKTGYKTKALNEPTNKNYYQAIRSKSYEMMNVSIFAYKTFKAEILVVSEGGD